jgi:hypothetical protein
MNDRSAPDRPAERSLTDSRPAGARQAPRLAVRLGLSLRDDDGHTYAVEVLNVSAGGLQLCCDMATARRLNAGRAPQMFTAALPVAQAAPHVALVGLRRRYLRLDAAAGRALLGCDFVGLRPVAARRLAELTGVNAWVGATGEAGLRRRGLESARYGSAQSDPSATACGVSGA